MVRLCCEASSLLNAERRVYLNQKEKEGHNIQTYRGRFEKALQWWTHEYETRDEVGSRYMLIVEVEGRR